MLGENFGLINNTYADVNVVGYQIGGGLVGNHLSGTIMDSYAIGNITLADAYGGGLVGQNNRDIINCFAIGSVSASSS